MPRARLHEHRPHGRPQTARHPDAVDILADSDAHLVRGLIGLLQHVYSGQPADKILAFDFDSFLRRVGLDKHLSMGRRSGLEGMTKRIRLLASTLKETGNFPPNSPSRRLPSLAESKVEGMPRLHGHRAHGRPETAPAPPTPSTSTWSVASSAMCALPSLFSRNGGTARGRPRHASGNSPASFLGPHCATRTEKLHITP